VVRVVHLNLTTLGEGKSLGRRLMSLDFCHG
jgi:hypothetical protein